MALTIIITGSILGYLAIGAVLAYLAGLFDQADTNTLFWITWAWPAFVLVAAVYVVCIPAILAMALGQAMRRRNEDKPTAKDWGDHIEKGERGGGGRMPPPDEPIMKSGFFVRDPLHALYVQHETKGQPPTAVWGDEES